MKVFGRPIRWTRLVIVAVIAVLLAAFLGPFNTYTNTPLGLRLSFWAVLVVGIGSFAHPIVMYTLHHPKLADWPRISRLLLGSFVMSFPGLLVFLVADSWFRGRVHEFPHHIYLWLTVFVIGTAISYANFMPPFANIKNEEKDFHMDPDRVPFLKRIPKALGYRLVSLSMQDHYVEIVTIKGKELVHTKFVDALRELQHYPGTQIHRSHWVSETGISRILQEGRATVVETIDGRKLPVSGPYRAKVKQIVDQPRESG